jgi:hypothetical protein
MGQKRSSVKHKKELEACCTLPNPPTLVLFCLVTLFLSRQFGNEEKALLKGKRPTIGRQ